MEEDPGYPDDIKVGNICFDDTLLKKMTALVKPKAKPGLARR